MKTQNEAVSGNIFPAENSSPAADDGRGYVSVLCTVLIRAMISAV